MDGTTGIVLTVIGSVMAIVLGALKYANDRSKVTNDRIIKETELTVKLANIEKELTEIKALLVASTEKYNSLEKRVFILEQKGDK